MSEEKFTTRNKIIEATAEIVGRENNLNLTIREIAGRAGVNIASINYYFRSKDNLMEEVESMLLNKAGVIYEILQDKNKSAEARLISWGDKLMKFLVDYPGTLYIMVSRVLVNNRENGSLADYLSILINSLTPVIKELTGNDMEDEEILFHKAMQLMSAVVYPLLLYSGTGNNFFPAVSDEEERHRYLALLINSLKVTDSTGMPKL